MEIRVDYEKYLKLNEEQMIEALQKMIRCKSEGADPVQTKDGQLYPFGEGVQQALEQALELGRQLGFEVCNVDNYGGHIDFPGTGEEILDEKGKVTGYSKPQIMGILGHLDVVPAGSGWDFEPYGGQVANGKIYGRGTTDDKGPVISCLYAMKALKDAGYRPKNTIRLILGLDEETHWKGIEYYFSKIERPDYGFTPDADFPIINGEMGMLIFDLASKFAIFLDKGLEQMSINCCSSPNSVPDCCRVVVKGENAEQYSQIKEKAAEYEAETGYKVGCRGLGKSLELTTKGISAHGAKPESGLNAISVMMGFLGRLNFINEDHNDVIAFYNKHIGFCTDGSGLGIDFADEKKGKHVFNLGLIEMTQEAMRLTINIRYPVTFTDEDIFQGMEELLERYNMGLIKTDHKEPIYLDLDNAMVRTLLQVYQKHSGDRDATPLVIGGGTYARSTPNIVAYGALFPGDPDLMHQKNECLELSRLELMTKIYAEAIYRLAEEGYMA